MQVVLAGDDGSKPAAAAVEWARRLAAKGDAHLVIARVTGAGQDAPAGDASDAVTLIDGVHPASGLLTAADQRGADVVVLGRRGRGGFPSLPIGTTAHHVAASSRCPVVVVPVNDEPSDAPVERVVVGVDGLPGSVAAAEWAVRTFADAAFTVAHALELAPVFAQAGEGDEDLYDRARSRAVELMEDRWTRPFVDAGVSFDLAVEEGGPAEVLVGTAARVDADLVVVGRRDHAPMRGTLGGVSQRVLAYAPCAAAMVPLPADGA
jgi:nucleotide-binding universal stress UspA family protein